MGPGAGGGLLACLVFFVFPLRLLFAADEITCEMLYQNNSSSRRPAPLKLSAEPRKQHSECVSVRVQITAQELLEAKKLQLTIQSSSRITRRITIKPVQKKRMIKWIERPTKADVTCRKPIKPTVSNNVTVWELVYSCYRAERGERVSVSLTSGFRTSRVTHTVPEPAPQFDLSVDQRSRSVRVTVGPGDRVYIQWCFKHDQYLCTDTSPSTRITIDPSQSQSAVLNFTHRLPCLCLHVYYTFTDAERVLFCPFENVTLDALHGQVTMYESSVAWSSQCPAKYLKPSVTLCWRQHASSCIPVLNSTLVEISELKYNVSSVDKHPQMCFQFSFQGSHDVHCPFQPGQSTWDACVGPGRRSLRVSLTSSAPARTLSAQLCVLGQRGCVSRGHVHSVRMEGGATETQIHVPLHYLHERPCVQVWQSDPAQHGRRIMCPDYTHRRRGLFAVGALVLVVTVAILGRLIHQVTKRGVAGWLSTQRPVLLVCSSEQSAQVSAVCALASILQGELCAAVSMALWAQGSSGGKQQTGGGRPGVADLGPLPWLYGQWDAVREAGGRVLIAWSPEAKTAYERWREEERTETDRKERKREEDGGKERKREEDGGNEVAEDDGRLRGRREGRGRDERYGGDDHQREPTSVTGPVFMAALACLQGALLHGGEGKDHGVALVYFQGLGSSRDVPKELRGVPRYCLPQDFGGLIEELGGETSSGGRRPCWPRLLSKTLSLWLALRPAHRLRAWLPQTQRKKTQGPESWQEVTSEKTPDRVKSPLLAKVTAQGTGPERAALYGSP